MLRALLVLIALSLTTAPPAAAEARNGLPRAAADSRAEQNISASQAAAIVQRRFGGRVVDVDSYRRGGRLIYRVRLLQDEGRMRTIQVDGQSGDIIQRRR